MPSAAQSDDESKILYIKTTNFGPSVFLLGRAVFFFFSHLIYFVHLNALASSAKPKSTRLDCHTSSCDAEQRPVTSLLESNLVRGFFVNDYGCNYSISKQQQHSRSALESKKTLRLYLFFCIYTFLLYIYRALWEFWTVEWRRSNAERRKKRR